MKVLHEYKFLFEKVLLYFINIYPNVETSIEYFLSPKGNALI